jgi:hypothetical protein
MQINLYFDANDIRIDSKGVVLFVIFYLGGSGVEFFF